MAYKVNSHGLSDVGLVRQNNEDIFVQKAHLRFFALADGMGGHQAGEVASKETVELLCKYFEEQLQQRHDEISLQEALSILKHSIEYVNHKIYLLSHSDPDLKGMGTTLCCLYFHPQGVLYGHVGDSRIYRLRHNELQQLTNDHTLYRELVEMGQIEESREAKQQYKNIITKAIGTESMVEPSICVEALEKNDLYLLCSDGLSDMLNDQEIKEIIRQASSLEECSKRLISKAKIKGGLDNITVLLVKVLPSDEKKSLSR